mmetsp:Transcript_12697/g.23033  ORF Transcript_12697/g.23033 Transcript_12697/m.23033 type:complete len:199 (+) Transcript_12697:317-913(+)|eukprot:CAMPEP_0197526204 /NCGR_PEP_ID=MMETSP1318-20131121/16696_1 /TAXON_ID=552666 /ORGANISM="Partenskyella glossopodia, Strain RCC365" /LENGTH=198 /DNA_ID=CAMNT_0043080259 /DNA_START=260 /DNA_END=859 /DNA_ORIENTATION=+
MGLCASCDKEDEDEIETLRLLHKVCEAYDNVQVIAILGPEGKVLIDFWVDGNAQKTQRRIADNEGKSEVFWTLKTAAEQFGALMNCAYTPVVHIRGAKYLVSCFALRSHMLTLVSAPPEPNQFNTTEADRKIKSVLVELESRIATKSNNATASNSRSHQKGGSVYSSQPQSSIYSKYTSGSRYGAPAGNGRVSSPGYG